MNQSILAFNPPDSFLVLLAALGGGTIATLVTEWFRRRKTGAETDELSAKAVDIITKAAVHLVERTTALADAREAKLETKIANLETRIDHLSLVIDGLTEQLESHDIKPKTIPIVINQKN